MQIIKDIYYIFLIALGISITMLITISIIGYKGLGKDIKRIKEILFEEE